MRLSARSDLPASIGVLSIVFAPFPGIVRSYKLAAAGSLGARVLAKPMRRRLCLQPELPGREEGLSGKHTPAALARTFTLARAPALGLLWRTCGLYVASRAHY
jgi:hypothetical protein